MTLNELQVLQGLINRVDASKVGAAKIKSLVKLDREIQEKMSEFEEVRKKMFESYNLSANEKGEIHWKGHEKEKEITEKWQELLSENHDIINVNFLSEDEFYESINGLNVSQISFLEKHLVINELNNEKEN